MNGADTVLYKQTVIFYGLTSEIFFFHDISQLFDNYPIVEGGGGGWSDNLLSIRLNPLGSMRGAWIPMDIYYNFGRYDISHK